MQNHALDYETIRARQTVRAIELLNKAGRTFVCCPKTEHEWVVIVSGTPTQRPSEHGGVDLLDALCQAAMAVAL